MNNNTSVMSKILLYGPPFGRAISKGYGSGTGGYTRNMQTYLSSLEPNSWTLEPLFHTVRGEFGDMRELFAIRMVIDSYRIVTGLLRHRPDAVHILFGFTAAHPRVAFMTLICKLLNIALVCDLKAGAFISGYQKSSFFRRALLRFILRSAQTVLVEGKVYQAFLKETLNVEAHYFPNFVPSDEVPKDAPKRLTSDKLKVLFVGYCYHGKGVYEIIEGCAHAATTARLPIVLTFIGEEEAEFTAFVDAFEFPPNLTVKRSGRQSNVDVRNAMLENDVFCFPSRHQGEGHSNAINEAMMCGMVIISTRHGFLEDVLQEEGAYFINQNSAGDISAALVAINQDRTSARNKSAFARERLIAEFTSDMASLRLSRAYSQIITTAARDVLFKRQKKSQ